MQVLRVKGIYRVTRRAIGVLGRLRLGRGRDAPARTSWAAAICCRLGERGKDEQPAAAFWAARAT
eukprot:7879008-Pyramimonas_sp.AAC.2